MHAPSIDHGDAIGRRLKLAGTLCCALVLGQLLRFAAGESMEGIPGALGHLAQAAPLLALMIVAWWRPLIGGARIIVVGIALAGAYLASVGEPMVEVLAFMFAPAIVGGILLVGAGSIEARHPG